MASQAAPLPPPPPPSWPISAATIDFLAATDFVAGLGFVLSIQLVIITAYLLAKSRLTAKIIFITICISALLLMLSMAVFLIFMTEFIKSPEHWRAHRIPAAAAYFTGILAMWICDWSNVFRLAIFCSNQQRRPVLSLNVLLPIAIPVFLKVPRILLPCLVLHHLVHFELQPNHISKTFALAKTWRRAYWALTSVDNGICTALLAWKLGRAAWCTTLDPQSNHRAERIFRTLRFAFYITIISGLVPTCLAVAIAVQACNKQDQGFGHFLIRTLIFLYSWINLLATQIAYLTTIIKSHELLREDTTVRRAPDMDVIRDLQNPAVLSSVEERSTKTRPAHQLLSGFLHERKHSRDIHHLTVVQEQQETRKTSSEEGRRNHNRTQLSKLKSLLENLGLTHALPRNVDDMSSSKPRSRRLNDHQVHTEPSRTHLVVGRSESEQRGQPGVVATIGCPMDLEPRPDYWSDTGEIPAADEQRPPACQPPTCKSSLHCEDNDTIDVELPKPRETKGKLTPEKTAFPLNVNVANQKIFCMPLVTDYSYPPIHNNKDMLAPSPAHAHAGSSSLTRRYSASVATTPSYAPSTQVGSSLSLAKP